MFFNKTTVVPFKNAMELRRQNAVVDTCVSFTSFSKTLDPLVTKNGTTQVNNANFFFFYSKADVFVIAMATSINLNRP